MKMDNSVYIQPFNIENLEKDSIEYKLGTEIMRDIILEFCLGSKYNIEKQQLIESKGRLLEERCLLPNFHEYMQIFWKYLIGGLNQKIYYFTIYKNIFENIKDCFFSKLILHIEYFPNEDVYEASYSPENAYFNKDTGKLKELCIIIKIGCTEEEIKSNFMRAFAHELTHAYEDFLRQKANRKSFKEISKTTSHQHIKLNSDNEVEKFINSICYNLQKTEENAYITGLFGELIGMNEFMTDSISAYECLRKTEKYQTILSLKKEIEDLQKYGCKDQEHAEQILKFYNKITDKKYTSVIRIIKVLNYKFSKLWTDFRKKASKVLYDATLEKNKYNTISEAPRKIIEKQRNNNENIYL